MAGIEYRCYILQPEVVFRALTNVPVAVSPAAGLAFDTVTVGAYTDVLPEMLIRSGPTANSDAYGRVRERAAATAQSLQIGWASDAKGVGSWFQVDDAVVEALDLYMPWTKTPRIESDGTIYTDYARSSATYNKLPPASKLGWGVARWEPLAGSVATFDFTAAACYVTDADATSITDHTWTLPSGASFTVGNSSAESIEFEMSEGTGWLFLDLTDDNGGTLRRRIWCIAGDPNGFTVMADDIQYTRTQQGTRASFRLLEDLSKDTYPNGTLIAIVNPDETGADAVVFAGWHNDTRARGQGTERGFISDTELEILDLGLWMDKLGGFEVTVEYTDSAPSSWLQLKQANMDRYIVRLLAEYSNVLEFCDFEWSGVGSTYYPYPAFSSEGESLYAQTNFLAGAMAHTLTCNKYGTVAVKPDPQRVDHPTLSDPVWTPITRTTTVQAALTEASWESYEDTERWYPVNKWLNADAILAEATPAASAQIRPVFAVGPGTAPRQGTGHATKSRQIVTSVQELLARTGHDEQRANNAHPMRRWDLIPGVYDIDPAEMTWVTHTNSADTAGERGDVESAVRYLPVEFSVTHDAETGTQTETLSAEREVIGSPATQIVYPEITVPYVQLIIRRTNVVPQTYIAPKGIPAGLNQMALFGVTTSPLQACVAITNDFQTPSGSGGPTWAVTNLPYAYIFAVDAYSYESGQVDGWIMSAYNLYKITDIFGSLSTTLLLTETSPSQFANLDASFISPNLVMVTGRTTSGYTTTGLYTRCATDGINFSAKSYISPAHLSSVGICTDLRLSQHTVGKALASAYKTAAAGDVVGFVTTDYGATWAETNGTNGPVFATQGWYPAIAVHVPYDDNANDKIIYCIPPSSFYSTDPSNIYRTESDGTTETNLAQVGVLGSAPYGFSGRWVIDTCPINRQRLAYISTDTGSGNAVKVSTDAGDTISTASVGGGVTPTRVACAGDDEDVLYIGGLGYAGYSTDFGTTVDNRSGNLPANFLTYGFCGGLS